MNEWKKWFSILLCLAMTLIMLVPIGTLAQSLSGAGEQLQGEGPTQFTTEPPMADGSISPLPVTVELHYVGKYLFKVALLT